MANIKQSEAYFDFYSMQIDAKTPSILRFYVFSAKT